MIIDFHAHCFPDHLAQRALDQLSSVSGGLVRWHDGTAGDVRRVMAWHGVDRAVILNIAVTRSQQKNVNDFAASIDGDGLVSFGSVHPLAPDALDELERIASLGLKGVKFHPQYQGFAVDDARALPIYRKAARLGLVTVFHAGLDLGFEDSDAASPAAMARALPAFDGAPVVAAHMGGYSVWRQVFEHLAGLPIYFDTAFCHGHIPLPEAKKIIERHGVARVLFGTDLPWSGIENEMTFVHSLGLTAKEESQIMGGNAAVLLGL